MNPLETTDITRGVDALRRRWWIPVAAAVVGALLAYGAAGDESSATFEAVVATPVLLLNTTVTANPVPPVDALAADLQSEETIDSLGSSVDDVALVATVALDKTSVSVRGTAPELAQARAGTEAYANELAEQYQAFVKTQAGRVEASLTAGIEALSGTTGPDNSNGPENASTLAELQVQREVVASIANASPETPDVRQLSSGGNKTATALLLALALGLLSAGIVALSGLSGRRLRYRDDVERVTGRGTLISEVSRAQGNWGLGHVIDRLASGGPVTFVPVGDRPIEELRESLAGEASTDVVLAEPFSQATQSPPAAGPVVLVVRLGRDKRSELDLAHRTFSMAGGSFAGVIAIAPGTAQ